MAGLGIAGQSAALTLAERGARVRAWAPARAGHPAPPPDGVGLLERAGVTVVLGGDGVEQLTGDRPDWVIKSPGMRDEEPILAAAKEAGVPVVDEAELAWRLEPRPVVGVTGTNGKSTVCELIAAALAAHGTTAVVAGNTETGPALSRAPGNADVVVAELSSYQLRHSPELLPEIATFTNCTRDSWDRSGGPAGYAADKRRLFLRGNRAAPRCVLNCDDPLGAEMAGAAERAGAEVLRYGRGEDAELRLLSATWTLDRAEVQLDLRGDRLALATRLPGEHNALNAAAALGAAVLAGVPAGVAARGIGAASPVPGRLERVGAPGGGRDVFVDYAHNPDGIRQVLRTVRHAQGAAERRVVAVASAMAVFDDGQYEEMARELARGADRVVATTERFAPDAHLEEPPAFFAALRREGARELVVEPDRWAAITGAVETAAPRDVVLILGRGRRRTPIHDPAGEVSTALDREVAEAALGT